jgi:DNA-binding transcriptional regulator YiaG
MECGLRQSDVAAHLEVNQGRIVEWEQGKRLVPAPIRERLLALFEGEEWTAPLIDR